MAAAGSKARALLSRVRGVVEPHMRSARDKGASQFEGLLARNAEYVVKDKAAADKLLKQYVFTQLARCARRRPPLVPPPPPLRRPPRPPRAHLTPCTLPRRCRIPPGLAHSRQEAAAVRARLANLRELPVPEVATYLGFAAELYAWFAIGEIVGRGGTLTGYAV
jgi:F-type H+-transporting ATPase subunit g